MKFQKPSITVVKPQPEPQPESTPATERRVDIVQLEKLTRCPPAPTTISELFIDALIAIAIEGDKAKAEAAINDFLPEIIDMKTRVRDGQTQHMQILAAQIANISTDLCTQITNVIKLNTIIE